MTNAEKFQKVFGFYATEMWAKPEKEFLEWINSEALQAKPKTGEWIPCSETLPRQCAQYLVCCESGKYYVFWLNDSDYVRGMVDKEGIIAWMPLPMPYREESEVEE